MKKATIVILGLGNRGMTYAQFAAEKLESVEIVAVAEPKREQVERLLSDKNLKDVKVFNSADELFAHPKLADGIVIATQDRQHVGHAMAALEKGYDILLEKPIASTLADCIKIADEADRLGRKVMICHVLRYTVFYQTIKKMIESGAIGDVMSIEACEDVAYWHHAHSFVRGNWGNSETSGPMILNKCCHDMDLLSWMMNKKCQKISSFGSNNHFNKENAPEGATEFCFGGCKVKDACIYDCEKIYITGRTGVRHAQSFLVHSVTAFSGLEITEEDLYPALQTGPYGRCVYHCDNNVVDHQVVNAEFEDNTTASFQMCSFTNGNRDMKVMGTKGFIYTQDFGNVITCSKFNPLKEDYECVDIRTLTDDFSGHGGGDNVLFDDFINMLSIENFTSSTLTSIRTSIQSHLMAFAAEESRINGGKPVEI